MIFGSPPIVTNGLVLNLDAANMKSYPRSGTTWRDLSGFNNSGSLTNGPTFNSANGGSIVFDGVNDYVTVPFNSSLGLTSTGTLSIWCYPNTLSQGIYAGLVGMTTGGTSGQQSYYLHWRKNNDILSAGIQNSGTYNNISFPLPTTINWYYFVFTWNGSALNLYQNGILNASALQTINAQQLNTQVDIGGNMFGSAGGQDGFFNGRISTTQIYNRALSPSEVQQNYNAQKSRFNLQ